jgi:hypothetical protein
MCSNHKPQAPSDWRAGLCRATQILDSVVKQLYSSRKGFLHDQETSHIQS